MFIIDFFTNLDLDLIIRYEYCFIGFFLAGALSSQFGKRPKVQVATYATVCLVLVFFFFSLVIQGSARTQGSQGKELYNLVSNQALRAVFYLFLIFVLVWRMVKTCRAERVRKITLFNRLAHRKLRNV